MTMTTHGFARHIAACNNARLPGGRSPLLLRGVQLGWVDPSLVAPLAARGLTADADGAYAIDDPALLAELGRSLATDGYFRFRDEPFDIVAGRDSPVLGTIDRGALPGFGLLAAGVHLNGLVETTDGPHLWVGVRAANKLLDPGKLDHLVAGGIAAGHSPAETLIKEAGEECSLPPELARQAVKVGEITYCMDRPEGLRRDLLHCYDLILPADWMPAPNDGEVAEFRLLPLAEVFALVRDGDDFKFNVNLVLIDLFLRRGLLDENSPDGQRLRAGLSATSAL